MVGAGRDAARQRQPAHVHPPPPRALVNIALRSPSTPLSCTRGACGICIQTAQSHLEYIASTWRPIGISVASPERVSRALRLQTSLHTPALPSLSTSTTEDVSRQQRLLRPMETMSVAPYALQPLPELSDMREETRPDAALPALSPTRSSMHDPVSNQLSAPASQESFVSLHSASSTSAPRLETTNSNVSQLTSYTDSTSPASAFTEHPPRLYPAPSLESSQTRRPQTAHHLTVHTDSDYASTSPMIITSPVTTNGTKRTASGHVKNTPSLPNTPLTSTFTGHRARTDSISSASSSRAGDLAMTLKTRLGYAMAKVQHGWEHKSINEVERLAHHKTNPNRYSMSHLDYVRRPPSNGLTNGNHRYSFYETNGQTAWDRDAFQPSKRHSGTHASFISSSQPVLSTGPRLQPAADIRPASSSQPQYTAAAAPISQTSSTSNYNYATMMSPPRTPVNGQVRSSAPTIRTELQTAEAEREALQALFQLGSPHGSQQMHQFSHAVSQASSSQASPLRSEFATPRRVTFARSESDNSSRLGSSEGSGVDLREGEMVEV